MFDQNRVGKSVLAYFIAIFQLHVMKNEIAIWKYHVAPNFRGLKLS